MRSLHLDIDASGGRRSGLEQALREAVRSGQLTPGVVLPSTRSLASDLGFSRATVVEAFEQLVAEGYLAARQGANTVVAHIALPDVVGETEPPTPREPVPFDFMPGEPDASAFPRQAWLRSVRRTLADAPDSLFGYGDMRGTPELREALAVYLARSRAVVATPNSISIFPGFMGALSILCETFRARGITRIAIEDPTLFVCRDVVALSGLTAVPIDVDEHGIVVDQLAEADVGAAIVTPAHQYPMGNTMSPQRRADLVGWAQTADAWIIEDDYDGEFRYDRQPVGALQGLAPERVIYAGTVSKSLGAGLRLGWIVLPRELRDEVSKVKHARSGVSNLEQATLADFIDRGELDRHVRQMRVQYRTRQLALAERLQSFDWLSVPDVSAGLHLTCLISDGPSENQIVTEARARGVGIIGLEPHWFGHGADTGLVLGYSRLPRHRFGEGLDRLTDSLAAL